MQTALRHLADDVRERFARLRMRNHTAGDHSTAKTKRPSKVITQSPTGGACDDGGSGDRTETPDLIRPHVDTDSRTASLPPLPPTPSSSKDRPRRRRRTSTYLCPSASVATMGHIYEEIPSTTPPPQQRSGSISSCADAEVGRVFYVSPLDGALCRIFPVDERAVHRRQLACPHVRHQPSIVEDRPSSPPIDVVSIATSGLSAVRGRELRLCAACYRQLRSSLAADETATRHCRRRSDGTVSPSLSSSFYNSCDLALLNVPCCYSSEAGDVDNDHNHENELSSRDAVRSSDTDTLPATEAVAECHPVSGDVITDGTADTSRVAPVWALKFGEAGSAFTKFDGRQRSRTDEGPHRRPAFDEDGRRNSRRRQRPCRVVTDPSFDERRRPLRHADNSLLAILDSAPDGVDFRSHYLHPCDDFRRDVVDGVAAERVNCAKSTSCADVRSARRRSLAVCRRSDDDGRRRRFSRGAPSSREVGGSCRRSSACCSGSEPSLQGRAGVKSVYYNGLLSSMIDLTAAFDRASADDRLSCRATSGPRRSLRPSRQSSSDCCRRDRFTSTIHHSSGDLMLRSVQ